MEDRGCEAGLAAARMGFDTAVFAISLESIAMLACNPSIGGTSKGHLVREIDALGGEMGINTDKTFIQVRMLNTGKGPAVHSLRAQADKNLPQVNETDIERQENPIKAGRVGDILLREVRFQVCLPRRSILVNVYLATGVYLKSKIFIVSIRKTVGLQDYFLEKLSEALENLGFKLRRFKTGTPARLNKINRFFKDHRATWR